MRKVSRFWIGALGLALLISSDSSVATDLASRQLNFVAALKTNSPGVVVAVGDEGTILRSLDGGKTWSLAKSGTTATLTGVAAHDLHSRFVVVSKNGELLESVNQGLTWTRRIVSSKHLTALAFSPDGKRGVIVGEEGTVLTSADSGRTWGATALDPSYRLHSVAFNNSGKIVAAVGLRWTVNAPLPAGSLYLVSSDSGRNWRPASSPIRGYPHRVVPFTGTDEFGMCGSHGSLGNSAKNGSQWVQTQGVPTEQHLNHIVVAPGPRFVLAVGDGETIVRYDTVTMRWERVNVGSRSATLMSVTLLKDGKTAVAVGGPFSVWRSVDGGLAWTQVKVSLK